MLLAGFESYELDLRLWDTRNIILVATAGAIPGAIAAGLAALLGYAWPAVLLAAAVFLSSSIMLVFSLVTHFGLPYRSGRSSQDGSRVSRVGQHCARLRTFAECRPTRTISAADPRRSRRLLRGRSPYVPSGDCGLCFWTDRARGGVRFRAATSLCARRNADLPCRQERQRGPGPVGNVMGSNIANLLFIGGLSSTIRPM